jgi:hypothetical protein
MRNNKFTPIDKCLICMGRLNEDNTHFEQDVCDDCHRDNSKKEDQIDADDDWLGI